RAALDDQPALSSMRVSELPVQTRLSDSGLADNGYDLPMPTAGPVQRLASCSSSLSRPTKRVRPRAAAACRRERTVAAAVTSYTSIEVSNPLTGIGPSGFTTT